MFSGGGQSSLWGGEEGKKKEPYSLNLPIYLYKVNIILSDSLISTAAPRKNTNSHCLVKKECLAEISSYVNMCSLLAILRINTLTKLGPCNQLITVAF